MMQDQPNGCGKDAGGLPCGDIEDGHLVLCAKCRQAKPEDSSEPCELVKEFMEEEKKKAGLVMLTAYINLFEEMDEVRV